MLKISFYNIIQDICAFIKRNRAQFIIVLIVAVFGSGLGIVSAKKISDISNYLSLKHINLILLISGQRGFWGYFFVRALTSLFILLIMALLSNKFILSLLNIILLFIFCYLNVRTLTVTIILLRFSIVPAVIICIVPSLIFNILILGYVTIFTLQISYERKFCRNFNFFFLTLEALKDLIVPVILIVIACFFESILVTIFTLGITI